MLELQMVDLRIAVIFMSVFSAFRDISLAVASTME